MKINNIKELNKFLEALFAKKDYFKNVEWAEIEDGAKIKISAEFWHGPFNETPIKFKYFSTYSKEILSNHLTMAILGALTNGSYYFGICNGKMKIYKYIECY